MTQLPECTGPSVLTSMIPIEIFYLSSLATYAFFIFFAFFVSRRTRGRRSGRIASAAMLTLGMYVGAMILIYDLDTRSAHAVVWGIGWWGTCFTIPFWLHMTALLEAERRGAGDGILRPAQKLAVGFAYSAATIFAAAGTILPQPLSNWLFDNGSYGPAPWPYCQWTKFWAESGDYYFLFLAYFVICISYVIYRLARLAKRHHALAGSAKTADETGSALKIRNEYLWLVFATALLALAGVVVIISVNSGLAMPESVGHLMLAVGGLIVGLVISRHNTFVGEDNVAPDFYRASASVLVLCVAVVIAAFIGEGPGVSKMTLLLLVTLTIVFFVNVDQWWRLIDNLFLGPRIAEQRAKVRLSLEETPADPELIQAKIAYQKWSKETRKVFLMLGEGLSRSSIASSASMHISTVDLHIRRIKDGLALDKLEVVRAYAHKLLIHSRLYPEHAGDADRDTEPAAP